MFADKVLEACSITGTGSYSLGGAVGAYVTWRSKFATAAVAFYFATNAAGTKWEAGYGTLTYGSPDVLTRNLLGSSTGALINWQAADAPFYVYSMPSAVALSHLIIGGRAAARPAWAQRGLTWLDESDANAWSTTRAIRKLYTGAADVEEGRYEAADSMFVPSPRRPTSAKGAAGYTVTVNDIGRRFTFDNSAAGRTMTLPACSSVGAGFIVEAVALSLANFFTIAPNGTDAIDALAGGASLVIPGRCPVAIYCDGTQWRTTFDYTARRALLALTFSAVTSVDFQNIPSWVSNVELEGEAVPGTDGDKLALRTYTAAGALSSAGTDYAWALSAWNTSGLTAVYNSAGDSLMRLTDGIDAGLTNDGASFVINFPAMRNGRYAKAVWQAQYMDTAGAVTVGASGFGTRLLADSPSGLRLLTTAGGNITGRATLYGSA